MARSTASVSLALALAGATLSFAGCGGPSAPAPAATEDPPLRRNVDPPTPGPVRTGTPVPVTPEPPSPTQLPTADATATGDAAATGDTAATDSPASGPTGTPAATPVAGSPLPVTPPPLQPFPASTGLPPISGSAGGLFTVRFVEDVVPILKKRCASCHITGSSAPWAMFDAAGTPQYQAVHDHAGAMLTAVEARKMPPNGATVPSSEIAMLKAWVNSGAPPEPAGGGQPPAPGQPTPVPVATATPTATLQSVSFQKNVVPVLDARCASCHTFGGSGAGQLLLFGATHQANPNLIRARIADMIDAIEKGRMPPNAAPGTVTADELNALKLWVAAGTPNN